MLGMATAPAHAVDLYIGAGLGQSNADFDDLNNSITELDHKKTAWKVFAGGRVLLLGAELGYSDFGKPDDADSEIHYKGISAFGLLYAPLPVPFLDLYAKAGLARLEANGRNVTTTFSTDDTQFAYGLGAQFKIARLRSAASTRSSSWTARSPH